MILRFCHCGFHALHRLLHLLSCVIQLCERYLSRRSGRLRILLCCGNHGLDPLHRLFNLLIRRVYHMVWYLWVNPHTGVPPAQP